MLLLSLVPMSAIAADPFEPQTVPGSPHGRVETAPAPNVPGEGRDKVLVEALRGLVIVAPSPGKLEGRIDTTGIVIDRVDVPRAEDFVAHFTSYLGRPLSLALLDEINREIAAFYGRHDVPAVEAFNPPGQDVGNGVVRVAIIEGRMGRVRVTGARFFDASHVAAAIRTKPGERLLISGLRDDLDWLNDNPFRSVDLQLARGEDFASTDVVLDVRDRNPVRLYAGADNFGTELIGRERVFAGLNLGNAFGLDHRFSYQFTGGFDLAVLKAHAFNYVVPLAWRHELAVFGAYAESDPDADPVGFDLRGENGQLGLRYSLPLGIPIGDRHTLTLGADFKRSNNDLVFGTLRVFDTFTNVIQAGLRYEFSTRDRFGFTEFSADLKLSPGGIGDDNGNRAFSASRAGARSDYVYSLLQLRRTTRLPADWSWLSDLRIQVSTTNLLGSEQLAAAGHGSVRGYAEYAVTADQGLVLRNEIRPPEVPVELLDGGLQCVWFLDYGLVESVNRLPGEHGVALLSTGVGVHGWIARRVALSAEYGWQLRHLEQPGEGDGRFHLSLSIAY